MVPRSVCPRNGTEDVCLLHSAGGNGITSRRCRSRSIRVRFGRYQGRRATCQFYEEA